ncbi:hypothetical protein BDA99DRAFT_539812 [Phascolomyces articulosus]|uniref:Arrestin-like N-terminal domain-containing protein n=1 Tax=Phascolomyces articulosus TaxID=60185 RepID=A0AAD5K5M4_9FUNG|nr:hypothetical protein BDA99DRAFT_539812 [Phascolomyces articulosus]
MNASIIALDLFFPESVQFYAARPSSRQTKDDSLLTLSKASHPRRQKLRGKLRIVASHPTKVNHIEIKFLGQTELTWRDPLKSYHSILAERMNAHKTFRKSKSILLQDATLPSGVTELGFEITIPGHLYPTFKSKFVDIRYVVIAKIIPSNSKLHKKPFRAEKEIILEKTLMPQDVASGQVTGYICPRIPMRGSAQRDDYHFLWEFMVPKWVSLDQGFLEFDGVIRLLQKENNPADDDSVSSSSTSSSTSPSYRITGISKIEVDVVQQSFYHYEISEENPAMVLLTESPMAFSDRLTKRHLTMTNKEPSTYLHPPLETAIAFSFPISQKKNHLVTTPSDTTNITSSSSSSSFTKDTNTTSHRVKSLPYTRNRHYANKEPQRSSTCIIDTAQFYAPSTTISKDTFSFSLDSPFLEIRHYIRLIIHPAIASTNINNNPYYNKYDIKKKSNNNTNQQNTIAPICIGLPIHVTQNVSVTETEEDALPSYQSITRGTEELPDYDASVLQEELETESDGWDHQRRPSVATMRSSISSSTTTSRRPHHQHYPSDEIDLVDLYSRRNNSRQQTSSTSSEETGPITPALGQDPFDNIWPNNPNHSSRYSHYRPSSRVNHQQQHVLIQERRLEDFCLF